MSERRAPQRLRRSLLFVPGADARKIDRAKQSAADAVVFDLEDSVAPERKGEARGRVAEALRSGAFVDVLVRVNGTGTAEFAADLAAMVSAGARAVMLPKAESREQIASVGEALRAEEADHETSIVLLVESPLGVANALTLAGASPRVEALCLGIADFSLAMGLAEVDGSVGIGYHARCQLALAARALQVSAIDTIHLAVADEAAFREDAALGARLGCEGKLCLHPRQAEIANEIYTPTAQQIERARRVVEAWERAAAEGRGVFALDGRMIDAPLAAAERRVLERARRAGVFPG
jgi:citrate lyase subunit beta / citryl-CoA lyase